MGNLGSIKIIKRPPPASVQFKAIQDQIARELRPVGQAHVDARNKVVGNWETDVEFGYRVSVTGKQVTLSIVVENDGAQVSDDFTVGDLWKALDREGIRPHVIAPKNQGGRLAFQAGYQPHTRPVARSGGPGRASGPRVFAKRVQHPGFPPRKFSVAINKRLRRRFEKAVDRGVRLGSRKRR